MQFSCLFGEGDGPLGEKKRSSGFSQNETVRDETSKAHGTLDPEHPSETKLLVDPCEDDGPWMDVE